jgi:DNA-binding transcriptional ArsR family regulator
MGFNMSPSESVKPDWLPIAEPEHASGKQITPAADLPTVVSAKELYQSPLVSLRPLFDGLLWDGLTMLIARPKAGKSWLTLQCAVHVAGGRQVDGLTALAHGPVLYGAFEEPRARTMGRLRKLAPEGDWTENLHFIYELMPLMGGGAEQLAAIIQKLQPRLVVMDTFTALVKTGSKGGSDVFRSQYAEVSCLRKLAEEFRTAIVVVHHTRKGASDSAIEAVAGTGGIAAAVDTLWQLKRKSEAEATLDIVGRETEERTLAMRFDMEPLGWRILGDDDAQVLNSERREVLELLREDGALSPAQIAAELGKARPAVRMLLKRMKDDFLVEKQGVRYIPTHSKSYSVTERV